MWDCYKVIQHKQCEKLMLLCYAIFTQKWSTLKKRKEVSRQHKYVYLTTEPWCLGICVDVWYCVWTSMKGSVLKLFSEYRNLIIHTGSLPKSKTAYLFQRVWVWHCLPVWGVQSRTKREKQSMRKTKCSRGSVYLHHCGRTDINTGMLTLRSLSKCATFIPLIWRNGYLYLVAFNLSNKISHTCKCLTNKHVTFFFLAVRVQLIFDTVCEKWH